MLFKWGLHFGIVSKTLSYIHTEHMPYLSKIRLVYIRKVQNKVFVFLRPFSSFLWYFFCCLRLRKICFQVWSNILLKNILIHSLLNFLSYVYIAVFDAETALEDAKLLILEQV